MLEICIEDDGIGMPETVRRGTGTSLMQAFAKQLNGEMKRQPRDDQGTVISLIFPDPTPKLEPSPASSVS